MIYEDGYEVSELNDSINDESKIIDVIDLDSRDKAFLYVDGEIFESNPGDSHESIVNDILNEENTSRLRSDASEKLNTDNVAYGHVINNCAFIETPTTGVNLNDVVNVCSMKYDKVYLYKKNKCMIKRLAMKRLRKIADRKQDLFDTFSDIHKDAYGYRPHWTKEEYDSLSEEDIQEEIDDCVSYMQSDAYKRDMEREQEYMERMEQEYIENVKKMKQEQEEQDWRDEDEYYDSLEKSVKKRRQGSIKKKIKKHLIAMTDNVREVPANTSINVFKSEYDSLIKDGWNLVDSRQENSGIWGEFAYRPAGQGIENPIIYLREIFHFTQKSGYHTCVIVEHKYDTNGNIVSSGYRVFEDVKGRKIKDELTSGNIPSIIDNGYLNELPGITNYNDAKNEVDNITKTKQDVAK